MLVATRWSMMKSLLCAVALTVVGVAPAQAAGLLQLRAKVARYVRRAPRAKPKQAEVRPVDPGLRLDTRADPHPWRDAIIAGLASSSFFPF